MAYNPYANAGRTAPVVMHPQKGRKHANRPKSGVFSVLRRVEADGRWRPTRALVVGTYPVGGLFSLHELVHENGHAVHISAIRNRPAFTDWPDTLFTEAFADVPSWSVFEPQWQRKYLGKEVEPETALRAQFGNVILDVTWSLFELRLLRDPSSDPNLVWTEITSHFLHIEPHPEMPWWAMRVQLGGSPGYMVNYGLGAVLTAEIRKRTAEAIGPILLGMGAPVHVLQAGDDVRDIVDIAAVAVMDASGC
mgnify:CR=1 FL=1